MGILSLLLFALLSGSPLLQGSTARLGDAGASETRDAIAEDSLGALVPIRRRSEPCEQKAPNALPAPTTDVEPSETDAAEQTQFTEPPRTSSETVSVPLEPEPGPIGDGAAPVSSPQPEPQPEPQPTLTTDAESVEHSSIETKTSRSTSPAQGPPTAADPAETRVNIETAEQCAPPEPYIFRVEGAAPLELNQCTTGPSEAPEPLAAPQPTKALVFAVQQALQQSGYDPGPVDGLMGPRTAGAIKRFQRERGLEETGRLSFALLDQLQESAAP
jgi:hypothetical protein